MELIAARADASARRRGLQDEPLGFSLAMFVHACRYKHLYEALVGELGGTGGSMSFGGSFRMSSRKNCHPRSRIPMSHEN